MSNEAKNQEIDADSITEDEIKNWCINRRDNTFAYLSEIIRGEYSLEEVRNDILSFRREDKS
jgi:hypothetical protein